jgi:hypothetical protein
MKAPTLDEMFESWWTVYLAKQGRIAKQYSWEYKNALKAAWRAGRREGMRYPWGRKSESSREYLTRGNL